LIAFLVHHIATVSLVVGLSYSVVPSRTQSYQYSAHTIGLLILFLNDLSDLPGKPLPGGCTVRVGHMEKDGVVMNAFVKSADDG
jgi:hypothetical protein